MRGPESLPLLSPASGPGPPKGVAIGGGMSISETLIKGAVAVVTMDGTRREIAGGDVLIRGGVIAAVGQGLVTTGRVVQAAGCVVTPGLVNTHHHLFQTLTRAVPGYCVPSLTPRPGYLVESF